MALLYRDATKADITQIAPFSAKQFTRKFGHIYKPEDLKIHLEKACSEAYFTECFGKDHILLVLDEEAIIAYAKWGRLTLPVDHPVVPCLEIHRLYVSDEYRNQGIGQKLMDQMLARMEDQQMIYLSVFSENYGAQRFYHRYRFSKLKEYDYMVGSHVDLDFIYQREQSPKAE
jgi:ribosomal protein S18 acetylase RimI-like enzyme